MRFLELRRQVVQQLLGDVVSLRDPVITPSEYDLLDLRTETLGSDEQRQAFYDRLRAFLASYATPNYLHAMTSFSLPEGRDPAGIDLWVFLAFEGHQGTLSQTSIEVSSPETGEVIFNYGVSETVPSRSRRLSE